MSEASSKAGFTVWVSDRTPHGPMDLTMVISLVKSGQIAAGTWIFDSRNATWERAANVPELQMYFQAWARTLRRRWKGSAQPEPLTSGPCGA